MSELKLRLNVDSYWPERWGWEESGLVEVIGMPDVSPVALRDVADEIRRFLEELHLPLAVEEDPQKTSAAEVIRIVANERRGSQLDVGGLKEQMNRFRRAEARLTSGVVILVNPSSFEPFGEPGEAERGIYGESYADGVCVLREYHKEAVRHELAHMLGMGEHCTTHMCLMHWSCPSDTFCPKCLNSIRAICFIEDV